MHVVHTWSVEVTCPWIDVWPHFSSPIPWLICVLCVCMARRRGTSCGGRSWTLCLFILWGHTGTYLTAARCTPRSLIDAVTLLVTLCGLLLVGVALERAMGVLPERCRAVLVNPVLHGQSRYHAVRRALDRAVPLLTTFFAFSSSTSHS